MSSTPSQRSITSAQMLPLLQSLPFLNGVSDERLQSLGEQAQVLSFTQGQPVCRRHASQRQLLLVLKGQVRLVVFSDQLPHRVGSLERLGPGQLLGWCELVGVEQQESALASEPTTVLAIPHSDLASLLQENESVRQRVLRSLPSSSLFYVLEAWITSCPLDLGGQLPRICQQLSSEAALHPVACRRFEQEQALPSDRRWFVINGNSPLALGTELVQGRWPEAVPLPEEPDAMVRLVSLPRISMEAALEQALARLQPSGDTKGEGSDQEQQPAGHSFSEWQQRTEALLALPSTEPEPLEEPEPPETHLDKLDPKDFPWFAGQGVSGAACAGFRMLSSYFNLPFRRELFKRVFDAQEKQHGSPSLALCGAVAESIGLHSQLLQIQADSLAQMEAPLMITWGDGIALLYRINKQGVVLGVPAGSGNQQLSLDAFIEQWGEEGEVLTLRRNRFTPSQRFGYRWFLPALKQHRGVLIEVLIASFFVQLFGLMNPLLIQQVIDKAIIKSSPDALGVLGLLLVVFAIFEGLLLSLRTFLFVDTSNRIDLSLGSSIIDHLLRLPLAFFDRRPVGEDDKIGLGPPAR